MTKATQVQIADEVGLDVSSVNKILNMVPGPKFHRDTIKAVRAAARRLGYRRKCAGCRQELFPSITPTFTFESAKTICPSCIEAVQLAPSVFRNRTIDALRDRAGKLSAPGPEIAPTEPLGPDFGDPRAPRFGVSQ